MFILVIYSWKSSSVEIFSFIHKSKKTIFILLIVFYIPLLSYKSLNYAFNRHFELTNRSQMALYGNLTRRSSLPLNKENVLSHLSTVPVSHDVCENFFSNSVCAQWSMSASDETFLNRMDSLKLTSLSDYQKTKIIKQETAQALLLNPLLQIVYAIQEGLKMFFWETSQGAFVVYPYWLERLFNNNICVLFTSFAMGGLYLAGYFLSIFFIKNRLILIIFILTTILITLFSFVHILHRYAIVAAPLMILLTFSSLSILIQSFSSKSE
jgi:hypothetical protein